MVPQFTDDFDGGFALDRNEGGIGHAVDLGDRSDAGNAAERWSRLGWTAQILPAKPSSRVRRIATSHSSPPMKAMDLGDRAGGSRGSARARPQPPERPQQGARNDVALDFAGAFPDALDPRIAPDALERQLVHEPHAAVDLDRLVGDEGQHFGGLQLGHGHVHVVDRSLVELPGGFEGEQPGGLQFHRHVGELEGHALELADLLAELAAVHRPLPGMIQGALGAADAGGGDLQPRRAQPVIGDLEALVDFAEHLPTSCTRQSVNSRMQLL